LTVTKISLFATSCEFNDKECVLLCGRSMGPIMHLACPYVRLFRTGS